MRIQRTNNLIIAAMCAALCVLLPMAFHAIPNAGSIFLPMHIPILLCGSLCGSLISSKSGAPVTPMLRARFCYSPDSAVVCG